MDKEEFLWTLTVIAISQVTVMIGMLPILWM